MGNSLAQRVLRIQSAAARLRLLYGLAWFVSVVLGLLLVLVVIDNSLRLDNVFGRWGLSLVALSVVVFAFGKWIWPNLIIRQDVIATARRIERRFPELQERLSSAMAFLKQRELDPTAGSIALRRTVITDAETQSAALDFRKVLDGRAARRALAAAGTIIALAASIAMFNNAAAGLAVARLVQPWRALPWPRRHQLAFVDAPQRLAKGSHFEATLVDQRGKLPADAEILMRYESRAGWRTEVKPLLMTGERVALQQSNVTHGFEYRARGGDDDTMPWKKLEIIEPPQVTELQIDVRPPAYSGLPPDRQSRIVKALVGSRIHLAGRVDRPIRTVRLRAQTTNLVLPDINVSPDGRHFETAADWIIEGTGSIFMDFVDEYELTHFGIESIELNAKPDAPPTINWELPHNDSKVTAAGASVPIHAAAIDDLAITAVQLRYSRLHATAEESIDVHVDSGDHVAIDASWDLSRLKDLQPGEEIAVRLTAQDNKGQITTTAIRRLRVISNEEFDEHLASRQGEILSRLTEAIELARKGRAQSQLLQNRAGDADQVSPDVTASLQTAINQHQQLARALANTPEGVAGWLADLLTAIAANHRGNEAAGRTLRQIARQVQELNDGLVPAIERELTEASKIQSRLPFVAHVNQAGIRQEQLIAELERMAGGLAEWENLDRITLEINHIRQQQEHLAAETEALRLRGIVAASDRTQADRAAARQQADQQLELARRFDKLQVGMEELAQQSKSEDPAMAGVKGALELVRQLAVGSRMREAASRLAQSQFGEAQKHEQEVLDGLRQLMLAFSPTESADGQATDAGNTGRGSKNREPNRGTANAGPGTGDPVVQPRGGSSRIDRGPSMEPKEMVGRLWGHLPDRMRQQLQSSFSEQFLPQYERLIEEYYKRLAEERPHVP